MIAARRRAAGAPLGINLPLVGGVALVLLVLGVTGLIGEDMFLLFTGGVGSLAMIYLAWQLNPAWSVSLGLALTVFSGKWSLILGDVPIGPDRVLILVGLASALLGGPAVAERGRLRRLDAGTWLILAAIIWTVGSALANDTLRGGGATDLLDNFGVVPLLLLLAAPAIYRTQRDRLVLIGTLTALGAYLGITAFGETIGGLSALVYPDYILDPNVGIHADRARGPFAQAVGNGVALYACGLAALIGSRAWTRDWQRLGSLAVAGLCAAGMLFTLTRSIWLSAVVATGVVMVAHQPLRRFILPAVIAGTTIVAALLIFVPGLAGDAEDRRSNQIPIWDRLNLNSAAVNMVEDRPLLGSGWSTFTRESAPYFEQADDYPLTAVGLSAHNTFLSHAAEIGLIGLSLWLAGLVTIVVMVLRARPPPEMRLMQIGFTAYAIQWVIVANFVLINYPFANLLLFLWAGVVLSADRRDPATVAERSAAGRPAGATVRA